MENSISSNLAQNGQKLIHSIQIKLRVGPAKSERIAVFSNIKFYIYQKAECKKSFLWIELSCIKVTDKDVTLKFGKNVFHIYPTDIKLFLSCIFDVIQRVLLPSELEKLDFYSFHSFIALPNPFSVSSRIRMKIEEKKMSYDRELVQPITDTLSYKRKDLYLSKFDSELLPFFVEAIPLYIGIRSIKIASSGKVDAYQYVSNLVLEKTNLRLIDVNGYSNANFEKYMANLSLNKSPKLLSLSFESSFFQESQLNLLKNMYKKSNLMGLEFHNAVSPQAFDFFHDSFFLSLNLKSLNLDGTRGINLPRILILLPGLVLLSLENCDLDISDVIIQIQNLQKLRSINLSGNRCTNYVKLRTQLPPNVLSVYANNVTWEKQCLVEFFKYRLMKLSISYISASSDEWQRLFDSLPDNQNNTLASIIWDGNNLHSNFFNYLKNQVCLNYLSLNDCFNQHHIDCLSYLTDYLKFQNSELDTFSLRGTESNNIGEYLPNILDIIMRNTKIHTLDVYGQRGGDQSIITIIENLGNMKIISCDKMNLTKGALLYDLAEKANSYQVWLSYPSEDISMLVHTAKLSASDSKTLYNKFRMLPKRIKKQPPRVLYPPPSCSAFDFPFQVYKFYPENEFPRYLKEKQLAFYDRAPPMASVIPSIKLPNGQKQAVPSPQPSPQPSPPPLQQSQYQNQSSPKPSQVQTITTFAPPEHQSPSKYSNKPSPTFALGSPINDQLNQTYNRKSPSNYEMNQNFNRSSPSVSKNHQKMGNTSPNSMYKETVRPPPPRFIFEDDPITLEMSREDETILPTIDEEFFPANNNYNNNNYNNNYDKRHNNNYNNDKYNNYNDDNNNYDRYNNTKNLVNKSRFNNNRSQKQNYEEEQSQSRNRHRSNPSRNERSVSRSNKKVIERNEEEDFFDNDEYENDNQNVFRVSTRGRRYENENEDENEENLRRTSKSRQPQSRSRSSRPSRTNTTATTPSGGGNRRSTSRQRHNHRIRKNNNNNDYDYEDADSDEEFFDYDNEYDEENQQRRGRNSRSRKMSSTERARRNKPRFNNEDEDSFDEINDDYDDQNELKNQSRRRKRTPTKGKVAIVSKTPSPYSRQRQAQSQRPRQSQSRQHQHQHQQSLSRSQHRRDQPSRNERNRIVEVDVNNDIEEYEEEEFNYSEDNLPNYKLKPQPQKRIRNVHQQQRQKQEQRGQSHRPRVQKPKNDQYDYDEDNDDDDRFYRQSSSRQQHQNRAQQSRSSRPVQKRSNDIPERKKQSIDRNHDASSRQQAHSRSRSRNNNQRMHNYNKDFDGDNYEDDNYVNNDDSQSYSVKRKGHSQRNPSRSSRQRSDHSHTQRIVRNINRNGSPKPSRRPAPKYVKNFSFSSADSYE